MSLQWTFVALFLYCEIFLIILLLLPFISATRWRTVFRSRLFKSIASYMNLYFGVIMVILGILFADSIREVRKYSLTEKSEINTTSNLNTLDNVHMKLFRAQRNLYIAGFSVFLCIVIRRLIKLVLNEATLGAEKDAAIKQAEGATAMAQKLLDEAEERKNKNAEGTDIDREALETELNETKEKLMDVRQELERVRDDLSSMKKQAEGTNREYDRLLEEHAKLQAKVEVSEESKKDS